MDHHRIRVGGRIDRLVYLIPRNAAGNQQAPASESPESIGNTTMAAGKYWVLLVGIVLVAWLLHGVHGQPAPSASSQPRQANQVPAPVPNQAEPQVQLSPPETFNSAPSSDAPEQSVGDSNQYRPTQPSVSEGGPVPSTQQPTPAQHRDCTGQEQQLEEDQGFLDMARSSLSEDERRVRNGEQSLNGDSDVSSQLARAQDDVQKWEDKVATDRENLSECRSSS